MSECWHYIRRHYKRYALYVIQEISTWRASVLHWYFRFTASVSFHTLSNHDLGTENRMCISIVKEPLQQEQEITAIFFTAWSWESHRNIGANGASELWMDGWKGARIHKSTGLRPPQPACQPALWVTESRTPEWMRYPPSCAAPCRKLERLFLGGQTAEQTSNLWSMSVGFSDIAGIYYKQHCLSDRLVGLASPPVQCSNTGLKMRNKIWEIITQSMSENPTFVL